MDLETDALLFAKPTSRKRRLFKATLFSENSLKQHREVQIYGLLAHRIWLALEGDPVVADYNESPCKIVIPHKNATFKHQFRFAVRRKDGTVQVIDIDDGGFKTDKTDPAEPIEGPSEEAAIQDWCGAQEIQYRRITRDDLARDELKLSNIRIMLKFIESANEARQPMPEEQVELIVANLAPIPIRRVLEALPSADQTVLIAHLARSILSGRFNAPIERRNFDGALVIDLAET